MKLAVIPARGGSKRIPQKNIKKFAGRPLLAHSIQTAQKAGVFDHIIVSTDCQKIAEVALEYGAEVPFIRPSSLSDDHTGTQAVVRHAISYCSKQNVKPEYVCCLYATAPLLLAEQLADGLTQLIAAPEKDYAFSACTFAFPVQRALLADGDGVQPMFPEHIGKRSQDLAEAFHDAGQFYWGRTDAFLQQRPVFSATSVPILLPRYRVQDIDTLEDWQTAELLYKALN
ncbi:pseudaminic acid cytidylyltransferase [Gayadomonas joobiniege]|uniref:pseudaminic acid cytidylyltransferase n=1 Tax=Gayadomonas joobiniege TaxID=1234606 RepID=UPI00036C8A0D|nr:pseudaminic acid cytidylyltransferase [Gayadomonas joobiniege]